MVNNGWGDIPRVLRENDQLEEGLDHLGEYIWEESPLFSTYPEHKGGGVQIDMYSAYLYRGYSGGRPDVEKRLMDQFAKPGTISDVSLAINKGLYVYHAIEGTLPGEDYPVGYDGPSKMGDYYRHVIPTIRATVDDIPEQYRQFVAQSDAVSFESDRLLDGALIDRLFPSIVPE